VQVGLYVKCPLFCYQFWTNFERVDKLNKTSTYHVLLKVQSAAVRLLRAGKHTNAAKLAGALLLLSVGLLAKSEQSFIY
jgi:hypothetical protein